MSTASDAHTAPLVLTLTARPPAWVDIGGLGGKLLTAVRYGVKANYREYNAKTHVWSVHLSWLSWLVHLSRSYGYEVNYGALPMEWQLLAAGANLLADMQGLDESPFAKLFLLDDAPLTVVQAAYRALSKVYHPDIAGGNPERFREISAAYKAILSRRSDGGTKKS